MPNRREVYAAFDSERDYQDMRKVRDGGQEFHSIEEFLVYAKVYLDDTMRVSATTWGPDAAPKTLDMLRKVGALVVACMEQHGAPQRVGFERKVPIASLDVMEGEAPTTVLVLGHPIATETLL